MNRLLVNPLPHGVRLHAIIDACHSGSALDLEFKCKVKDTGVKWKPEYTRRPAAYKVIAAQSFKSLCTVSSNKECSCKIGAALEISIQHQENIVKLLEYSGF